MPDTLKLLGLHVEVVLDHDIISELEYLFWQKSQTSLAVPKFIRAWEELRDAFAALNNDSAHVVITNKLDVDARR